MRKFCSQFWPFVGGHPGMSSALAFLRRTHLLGRETPNFGQHVAAVEGLPAMRPPSTGEFAGTARAEFRGAVCDAPQPAHRRRVTVEAVVLPAMPDKEPQSGRGARQFSSKARVCAAVIRDIGRAVVRLTCGAAIGVCGRNEAGDEHNP